MSSPSVEVVSVEWGEGTDKRRARRLAQLLYGHQSEREPPADGARDDNTQSEDDGE